MAAIFEYEKQKPHINYDDNYIINAQLSNDILFLYYSIKGLDPLSVCLSNLNKLDYIKQVDFKNNTLIFNYASEYIQPLSIDIKSLDKYISSINIDQNGIVTLTYNNGSQPISADLKTFNQDHYINNISLDTQSNNLSLIYNKDFNPLSVNLPYMKDNILSDINILATMTLGNIVSGLQTLVTRLGGNQELNI